MENKLIYPRKVWSWNECDGSDGETPILIDTSEEIDKFYKVGEKSRTHAGAPGVGYTDYIVTKINKSGVWGRIIKDTIRELEEYANFLNGNNS